MSRQMIEDIATALRHGRALVDFARQNIAGEGRELVIVIVDHHIAALTRLRDRLRTEQPAEAVK